MPIIEQKR